MNLVALIGRLARPAEERALPSGDRLVAYQITIPRAEAKADSVPVVWFDAPAHAVDHAVDDELVVVGRVVRRFFQAGGSLQSRTEVVADVVVPRRQSRRANQALARAAQQLADCP
jgi:single-stranded DNA-binding protein